MNRPLTLWPTDAFTAVYDDDSPEPMRAHGPPYHLVGKWVFMVMQNDEILFGRVHNVAAYAPKDSPNWLENYALDIEVHDASFEPGHSYQTNYHSSDIFLISEASPP